MTSTLDTPADIMPEVTDEKPTIDASEARRLIQQATNQYGVSHVDTHGDYWVFNQHAQPVAACIVGVVLHALGAPLDQLGPLPYPALYDEGTDYSWTSNDHYRDLPADFTREAEHVLAIAMNLNDSGWEWGDIANALKRDGDLKLSDLLGDDFEF